MGTLNWLLEHQIIEITAALLSLWCVWLAAKNHVLNWPIAMIASILYFLVFYYNRFYSESYLQGVFFLFQAYGWWFWLQKSDLSETRAITKISMTNTLKLLLILAFAYGVWLYCYRIINPDARFPAIDTLLTVLSLGALWMQARKWIEHWYLWILVDIGYVPMFYLGGNRITAVLYALFIVLAIKGYRMWLHEMKKPHEGAF